MNNDRPNNTRFLPHSVQNFLWGRARRRHDQQQHIAQSEQEQGRHVIQDREMTPIEDLDADQQGLISSSRPPEEYEDNHSDHSMPSLRTVSDLSDSDSDSQDARDVEMSVVEDDDSHEWTDDEDAPPPPLETVPPIEHTHHRVQVEEEQEEPPIIRTNTMPPLPPNANDLPRLPNLPPWAFGPGTSRGQQPDFHRLFPMFSQRGPRPPPPNPQSDQPNTHRGENPNPPPPSLPSPSPPGPGRPHVHAHAYVLAFDTNGRPVTIQMGLPPGAGPAPPQGTPMFDFAMGGGGRSGVFAFNGTMPTWADVMLMFGREADEREDPERAKKLVNGLEEVPVGLVKRMIRVGGAPGGHVDDAQAQTSETPGCAICWDSLLNEDDETIDTPEEQTKIVSLPCSHVFHSSCLIPWFSKPKHTTCPTCRFNIDPENLTHTPRQPQTRQPGTPPDQQPPSTPVQQAQFNPDHPAADPQQPPLQPDSRAGQSLPQAEQPQQFPFPEFQSAMFDNVIPSGIPRPNFATDHSPHTVHHGHTQGSGFTVDFTWQIPNNSDQDDDRFAEDLQNQASAFVQQFLGGIGGAPNTGGMPRMGPRAPNLFNRSTSTPSGPPQPRKEWSPPPAPGPTLRQRIESKEREAGLRCDDISCGIGPSDEDPHPSHSSLRQISISHETDRDTNACSHKFHPSCLVSADRCSGWGDDVEHEKVPYEIVSCPMCRAIGSVPRDVWDEGAQILMI